MLGPETDPFLTQIFDRVGYLAPFFVLLGAGAGLPVPEEVTMLGSGFLLFQGRVEFARIVATCYVATLLGDSIPFWLGRTLGMNLMDHPILKRLVHPERRALLDERFRRHGTWAVFTCRFLPGVRLPGFFTAGTLGMSYPRFLASDGAAALIMTPFWILVGRAFGERIAALEREVQHLNQILAFGLAAVIIAGVVHFLVHTREKQLERLETHEEEGGEARSEAPPEGPPPPPPDGDRDRDPGPGPG